ncbi:MAG: hypothetical protein ABEJ95_05970 [Candidatus Nanohalobium sp.]
MSTGRRNTGEPDSLEYFLSGRFNGEDVEKRMDQISGAVKHTQEILEENNRKAMKHASRNLKEAMDDMDQLFKEERLCYPINTSLVDEIGEEIEKLGVVVIDSNANSYREAIPKLEEINRKLGEADPTASYKGDPAPRAIIDYSEELTELFKDAQKTREKILEENTYSLETVPERYRNELN